VGTQFFWGGSNIWLGGPRGSAHRLAVKKRERRRVARMDDCEKEKKRNLCEARLYSYQGREKSGRTPKKKGGKKKEQRRRGGVERIVEAVVRGKKGVPSDGRRKRKTQAALSGPLLAESLP